MDWYPGFYLFRYGDAIWWPIIYFSFYFWGSIFASKASKFKFSISRLTESARVIVFSPFISCGCSLDIGNMEKTELLILSFHFMSIGNGKAAATSCGHSSSIAAAYMGRKIAFSRFPPLGECGKVAVAALPPLPWAVKLQYSCFPPLREEENPQLQLYPRSHRR